MGLSEDLDAADAQLGIDYEKRAKNQATALKIVKIGAVVVGSIIAGIAQFSALPPPPEGYLVYVPLSNAIGIIATIIVGIGGLYVVVTDQDVVGELENARKAIGAARKLESDLQSVMDILDDARRARELYLAILQMRNIIERSFFDEPFDDAKVIQACLKAADRSLRMAFQFAQQDHWTISVYRANRRDCYPAELECIAHLRSIECEVKDARKWPEGIGVTGIAYARGTEVVIPDLAARELGTLHDITRLSKPADGTRYRSIVGVPVLIGPKHEKWGMVVATSDSPDHFTLDDDEGVKATEAARALAAMIALLLAHHIGSAPATRSPPSGQPTPPAPTPPPPATPGGGTVTPGT